MVSSMNTRATALVSGHVQGVGFRAWVVRHAKPLGLCGHAKNLADGNVEIVAEGERARVEKLLELLADAPGEVSDVKVEYSDATGLSGFERR